MILGYVLDDTLDKEDGVQKAVIDIAEHMRSLGHDVHYIVPDTKRTDLKNVHSVARIMSMKFNGNSVRTPLPASRRKIKQLMRGVAFDAIHVQMPYSPLLAARVVRYAPPRTRIVGTFHILPYNWTARFGTKLLGMWLWRNKKRFNTVYAVSPPALRFMQQDFGLDGSVLPNPVDYEFFNSYATKQKNSTTKIIFVGRFEERKGVKQLVEAYSLLDEDTRNSIELKMCGKGPLLEELKAAASGTVLDIKFPGFISDEQKAQFLAESDIAIFPSTGGESFGIVLTEAMAAGAGVTLGGNNPGYASVLEPWPEALFDATSPQSIADKITEVSKNRTKYTEIGKSQQKAVEQYDINVVANHLLQNAYEDS